MSAPQTNIEKQKRWHKGPLIGIALVTLFGVSMVFIWLMGEAANGKKPGDPQPAATHNWAACTRSKPIRSTAQASCGLGGNRRRDEPAAPETADPVRR